MDVVDSRFRQRPLCVCLPAMFVLAPVAAAAVSPSALSIAVARTGVAAAQQTRASIVTNCSDDLHPQPGSLRYAIENAYDGETIDLSQLGNDPFSDCGFLPEIKLSGGAILVPNVALTLHGPDGGTVLISSYGSERNFTSLSPSLAIENLAIYGGNSSTSGGSINATGNLTLTNSQVYDAQAVARGGCVFANGAVTLQSSTLTNCTITAGDGGAIRAGGDVVLQNSSILAGHAVTGGGCISASGSVSLQHSTVSGCTALDTSIYTGQQVLYQTVGGGIVADTVTLSDASRVADSLAKGPYWSPYDVNLGYLGYGGGVRANTFICSDSTIHNNKVPGYNAGGGISAGQLTLTRCTVDGNTGGSAIAITGQAHVTNSTISGNYRIGIRAVGGNLTLTSSTVTGNGINGLALYGTIITPQSSIVFGNGPGPGFYDIKMADIVSYLFTGSDNLIGPTSPPAAQGVVTVTADPQLLPLADNGGPTWTHALPAGSPARNKGNNAGHLANDQRGDGYVRAFGRPDIGAFELQVPGDEIFYGGFD